MAIDGCVRLSWFQTAVKRSFDIIFSILGLLLFGWLIFIAYVAATVDTLSNGFFVQERVGQNARVFRVIKIKTMKGVRGVNTSVTAAGDPRITKLGAFFRKTKIDELPQLINVLLGQMSFVGPRPDVPGFADKLEGVDRSVLTIKPGITGPASIKYKAEEELLAAQEDPELYNQNVIFPDKTRINVEYIRRWTLKRDCYFILKTILS